ncbi:Uncharacterised protein [Mycobacteroides abscessus]|nr:Uncharacterised protein [Mycobacteroides abscessus]
MAVARGQHRSYADERRQAADRRPARAHGDRRGGVGEHVREGVGTGPARDAGEHAAHGLDVVHEEEGASGRAVEPRSPTVRRAVVRPDRGRPWTAR